MLEFEFNRLSNNRRKEMELKWKLRNPDILRATSVTGTTLVGFENPG